MMDYRQAGLLDCTLRDGGFVNDWAFGQDNIVNIFERLIASGVNAVEVGFLDERRSYAPGSTMFPDTESLTRTFGRLDKKNTMLVAMIDLGTCGIEHLQPAEETCIDGIRVIFKKHRKEEAIDFCRQVKALGYKVFVNAVSITSYSDRELLDLVDLVNDLEPYGLSMVDTYGLMHEDHVLHYFELLDYNLKPGIVIGYHSHNNFQLAYSNSIELLKYPASHYLLIDGSLYGMGKSAGNLPIELISMYMNANAGTNYDTAQMLETIDMNIMPFFMRSPWGYKLFFYIAAANKCHPNYVKQLMGKQTLSLSQIGELLQQLEGEKKLLYDKDYMEELYLRYQSRSCNDERDMEELARALDGRCVLLVGPGSTMETERDRVEAFIRREEPVVIAVNYLPETVHPRYIFTSNSRRYMQLNTRLSLTPEDEKRDIVLIATSNVTAVSGQFDQVLNYSSLIDREAEIPDNSFVMLLKVMRRAGVRKVACAGFDGYSSQGGNYWNADMEYEIARQKSEGINRYVDGILHDMAGELQVEFITSSRYQQR